MNLPKENFTGSSVFLETHRFQSLSIRSRATALFLGFILCVPSAYAGLNKWTRSGPGAGTIHCIVFDPASPETIYVGHFDGVHKSTDGGLTWSGAENGLPDHLTQSSGNLAIDPHHPGTLYASCAYNGIYKSVDSGASWRVVNAAISNAVLAIDPVNPDVIYAGSFGEVYRSVDGGITWEGTLHGLVDGYVEYLVIDPLHPRTLYAGVRYEGIYRTLDGGGHWTNMFETIGYLESLAIDPVSPSTLYASGVDGSVLLRSTDGGLVWQRIAEDLWADAIAIDPLAPACIYAAGHNGFYKSTNGGVSWASIGPANVDRSVRALGVSPSLPGTVYAAAWDGFHKSIDGGANWERLGLSFPTGPVYIDSSVPPRVYLGCLGGVSYSSDGGLSWRFSNMADNLSGCAVLVGDPDEASTLYASAPLGRFFKSTDGGGSWENLSYRFASMNVTAIAPGHQGVIYVGTNPKGAFKSLDGGLSWEPVDALNQHGPFTYITCLTVDNVTPNRIFAGVEDGEGLGLFRSLDGGLSWGRIGEGLPTAYIPFLIQHPLQRDILYTASAGLFKSTDSGEHFQRVPVGRSGYGAISVALDNLDPNNVFASEGEGVFRSADSGGTWSLIDHGLPGSRSLRFLTAEPHNPCRLYVLQNSDLYAIDLGDGDLNGDHAVNEVDAAMMQDFLVENRSSLPAGEEAADLAVDGPLNVLDLLLLRLKMAP